MQARIEVLEAAGYLVFGALTLPGAMAMANLRRPDLVIVGHTFTPDEQALFIEEVQEAHPDAHLVVLGPGVIRPIELAEACTHCWEGQPRGPRLLRLRGEEPESLLPWPVAKGETD